jgi:hypothetical protein
MTGNGRVISLGGQERSRVKVELGGRHYYRVIVKVPTREGSVSRMLGRLFRTATQADEFHKRVQPKVRSVMNEKIMAELAEETKQARQAAALEKARAYIREGELEEATMQEMAQRLNTAAEWGPVADAVGMSEDELRAGIRSELEARG